jgi:hypothetical protein
MAECWSWLLMITIRPKVWRPSNVTYAVAIGGFCLSPLVFRLDTFSELMGLACLVFMALLFWLLMRPIRLEITETEVRARQGWAPAPLGKSEALRSDIRSIHYLPKRFSFKGADGEVLMEPVDIWTVRDMVKVAEELRVPLYDDRVGLLGVRELSEGRLVYDPVSGLVARQVTGGDGR